MLASINCYCQQTTEDKRLLDSLIKNDVALKMFVTMNKPSSYVKLNAGITNKLFSVSNNSLNALEQDKQIIFTPSIEYFNKTGLSISFATFLLSNKNKYGFYQHSLTPSFDHNLGKLISAGISFTRVFIKDKYNSATSPIQNDLYAYAILKKTWLKPSIAFGYSTGLSNEITFIDTTVIMQNRIVRIQFTDTAEIHLQSFSVIGSLSHTFWGYDILTSNDAVSFTPQLSLNAGSNKFTVAHKLVTISYFNLKKLRRHTRIRNFNDDTVSPKFQLESLGLDLNVNYSLGKFDYNPRVYLDYYLPSSTEKRFTQVFAFTIGYTF
jgi:hypothetical protein